MWFKSITDNQSVIECKSVLKTPIKKSNTIK